MSRKGWTEKPCHGCGLATLHRASEVCRDCKELMADGHRLRAAVAETTQEVTNFAGQPHWIGYIRHSGETGRKFLDLLWRWLKSFPAAPEFVTGVVKMKRKEDSQGINVLAPPGTAQFASDLFDHAVELAKAAYLEGREDGSRLLVNLATGEYSVADFNKATMGAR